MIMIEEQRAYMQQILRGCKASIIIAVNEDSELVSAYMNLTSMERRGMIELLHDTAPRFFPVGEMDEDDAD
jgi:hypothetical protein